MREQLIQYIALLFAGASDCEEIKDEILQNTLDRYDDLVAQGKVPEAAYRLAIAGIGDINEILGTQSSELPPVSAVNNTPKSTASGSDKKKVMRAVSAGLYILSPAPVFFYQGHSTGFCLFFLFVAVATVLMMLGYEKKEKAPVSEELAGKLSAQKKIPLWIIIVITAAVTGTIILAVFGSNAHLNQNTAAATLATEPAFYDGPRAESFTNANATATAHVNVRSSPSPEASVVGMLSTGEYVTVSRSENVSGIEWSYVTSPTAGWVRSEYIQMELIVDYGYSAPEYGGITAKVLNTTDVYSAPSAESAITCPLNPGETVIVTRQETVNNIPWCYVTEPVSGWVQTAFLELTETIDPAIEETVATVQTLGYGCLAADVRELDIHWPHGSILILPKDTDRISVEETYNGTDCDLLVTRTDGELEIRFCNGEPEFWQNISKELTITVPTDWECDSLVILGGLADVEVCDLSVKELDYEGKSGNLDISTCAIENADLKTTSGSISLVGTMQQLETESVTAGIFAKLYNIPSRIEANSTEGDVTVMLPETTGFTLQCSHEFETDFDVTEENDRYIAGDGSARIKLDVPKGLSAILKTK